jgi:uncharacterized HAD superfamily protein
MGDSAVLPKYNLSLSAGDMKLTYDTKPYTMTTKEYTKYQQTLGKTQYDLLNKFQKGKEYESLTDAEKAKYRAFLIGYATDIAKAEFLTGRGIEYKTEYNDLRTALNAGITPDQYFKAYSIYRSYYDNKEYKAAYKAEHFGTEVSKELSYIGQQKINVLKTQLNYATIIPVSSERTDNLTALGLSQDKALQVYDTIAAMPDNSKKYQKLSTISGMGLSEQEKLKVIKEYYKPSETDTTYTKYATANELGVSVSDYTTFISDLSKLVGDKSASQDDVKTVLNKMNISKEDKGIIFAMQNKQWKSGNTYAPGLYYDDIDWVTD